MTVEDDVQRVKAMLEKQAARTFTPEEEAVFRNEFEKLRNPRWNIPTFTIELGQNDFLQPDSFFSVLDDGVRVGLTREQDTPQRWRWSASGDASKSRRNIGMVGYEDTIESAADRLRVALKWVRLRIKDEEKEATKNDGRQARGSAGADGGETGVRGRSGGSGNDDGRYA